MGLEANDPLVESGIAIAGQVTGLQMGELSVTYPSKGKNYVGAEMGIQIFGEKLCLSRVVLRPVCVVAHDLVALLPSWCRSFWKLVGRVHISPEQQGKLFARKFLRSELGIVDATFSLTPDSKLVVPGQ